MRLGRLSVTAILPVLLFGAACAKEGPGTAPATVSSASPTIVASLSPAPTQYNHGRKPVKFDPCAGIGDQVIEKIKFDPTTRKRDDQIHQDYSFIGCSFDQKGMMDGTVISTRSLTISSTNVALDEFRKKYGTNMSSAKVNGQDAILHQEDLGTCFLETAGPDGTLDFQMSILDPNSAAGPCDDLVNIANTVQAAVPK